MNWRIFQKAETASTNQDAREGAHGDVFVADFQTEGRGRLDHQWQSPPGTNLMMSAVLSVGGLSPAEVATLPLVAGLSVCEAVARWTERDKTRIKWPNDVLVGGRKIAGILCERQGDLVIVGIGVNVGQTSFPSELSARATSLALLGADCSVTDVRALTLERLGENYEAWRTNGFACVYPRIAAMDGLRGQSLSVRQTDDDSAPVGGVSSGIMSDGSLDVGGTRVYAGEAHVEKIGG